jgi:hypothetical protein
LATLGIRPRAETPPRLVRDYLNDLYRYEIRRLRDQRRDGCVNKDDYVPKVIELRKKYVPLSMTPDEWEAAFGGKA